MAQTDRSERAVWFWYLVVGFNDRFGDACCITAASLPDAQTFSA
ncbi:hypothetical protein NO357_15715 [Marimonas arenosa]|uniref:Uncharacterized protein n=1 Tax=Marimonas arenosa TaxID=1795305 RepID=A0AAE3WGT6_9RHOB|nr:hypothetical protein [Marimonas arenosa]